MNLIFENGGIIQGLLLWLKRFKIIKQISPKESKTSSYFQM